MSQSDAGTYRKQKWYNKNIFPLLPLLTIKKGDQHNTNGFTFRWLFFTFWSLDGVQFELTVVADTHWGIGVIGLLPYLRFVVTIPCPTKFAIWFDKHTTRKIKKRKSITERYRKS